QRGQHKDERSPASWEASCPAPCPCGSGRKYKHCCYGKDVEDDPGLSSCPQQPQYPIGTVALYGPDDKTTTKIAAGVILHDGAEPILVELPDGLVYCVYYEEGKGLSIRGVRLRVDSKGVTVEGKED